MDTATQYDRYDNILFLESYTLKSMIVHSDHPKDDKAATSQYYGFHSQNLVIVG